MANKHRGEASFKAAGQSWTLRFNANALCEFEEVAGVAVSAVRDASGIKFGHLRALVWAGLGFHHRRERGDILNAGDLIDEVGPEGIAEAVMRGLSSAFPQKEGGPASPPLAAQKEVGSNS